MGDRQGVLRRAVRDDFFVIGKFPSQDEPGTGMYCVGTNTHVIELRLRGPNSFEVHLRGSQRENTPVLGIKMRGGQVVGACLSTPGTQFQASFRNANVHTVVRRKSRCGYEAYREMKRRMSVLSRSRDSAVSAIIPRSSCLSAASDRAALAVLEVEAWNRPSEPRKMTKTRSRKSGSRRPSRGTRKSRRPSTRSRRLSTRSRRLSTRSLKPRGSVRRRRPTLHAI